MHRSLFVSALLLAVVPQFCSAADSALTVSDPYVRLVPPSAPTSAAFMVITNAGSSERLLVKAESPAARAVELHSHSNENGVMKMRRVPSIEVRAKGQAELKPGSYHIMLIEIAPALKEGDAIPIKLTFDDGSQIDVSAPVRKILAPLAADKTTAHQGMTH